MQKKIIYKVHSDYIELIEYPFECSLSYKNGKIKASDIVDVAEKFYPPAIRTVNKELILMAFQSEKEGEEHKKLPRFYADNNIKVRTDAADIWSLILDYFVDTEFSDEYIERNRALLEKHGISQDECNALRQEVSERMIAYNFESGLWDWFHLGLLDVLNAGKGILSGEKHRLSEADFEKFYWRTMDIALKGFVVNGVRQYGI